MMKLERNCSFLTTLHTIAKVTHIFKTCPLTSKYKHFDTQRSMIFSMMIYIMDYVTISHCFRLNTIAELNSTGSLLSDLNCLSRSDDDLETSNILQSQKKREWKEHRPSSEYSKKHRRSTKLHKTTELNSSDRIVATTTVVMPKDGTITASSTIEAIPGDENADPQVPLHNSRKRRKSSGGSRTEHNKSKLSHMNDHEVPIDVAVRH